jgi:hypothetical protein
MRLFALLVISAVVAGTAAGATAKEPRKAIKPAVQARAKRIALRLEDLPGFGWKATPAQSDRSKPTCPYYNPDRSRLTVNGSYTSPDFTRSDGLYASSSVDIFVSAGQARTAFGLGVRPELARCLGESVVKSGAPGHITLRSAGKLALPRYGDVSSAYRIVFSVKSGTNRVPATIDLVAIEKGAVDVALFFSSAGQPVPGSMERKVAALVAGRI